MKFKTKGIVLTAFFAAVICTATMIIRIPTPIGGYINMGDCFVLISAFCLGPVYGFAASGIGSMLADLISGYPQYIFPTFIIKGFMALFFALYVAGKNDYVVKNLRMIVTALLSEIIMIAGYFIFECFILGYGISAVSSIPGNVFQGIFGIISAFTLIKIISENSSLRELLIWRK